MHSYCGRWKYRSPCYGSNVKAAYTAGNELHVFDLDLRRHYPFPHVKNAWTKYHNDPKFSDLSNGVDLDQTGLLLMEQFDQGLHCLPFRLHLLNALICGKTMLFKFYDNCINFLCVRIFMVYWMEVQQYMPQLKMSRSYTIQGIIWPWLL